MSRETHVCIMRLLCLGALPILGFLLPYISGLAPDPDCLSSVDVCMSDLCSAAQTGGSCGEKGCPESELRGCNLSLALVLGQVLGQVPGLGAWACEQEPGLCLPVPELLTQCPPEPAAQRKRSSKNDWQLSTLLDMAPSAPESCLQSLQQCLGDPVCNRLLAPVLQECTGPDCETPRCREATVAFTRGMPLPVAQRLVMCQCQEEDEACVRMSSALHSGTCGAERRSCLQTARLCVGDRGCRRLLGVFQSRCWRSVDPHCLDDDLHTEQCFSQMKPSLILGARAECQAAFVDTVGTSLHFPCTCEGLLGPDLQTCAIIHELFHNRTHFIKQWKDDNAPTELPERSEDDVFDWSDYLLSGFACLMLMGITVLVISIIIILVRRQKKKQMHSFQKSHTVIL